MSRIKQIKLSGSERSDGAGTLQSARQDTTADPATRGIKPSSTSKLQVVNVQNAKPRCTGGKRNSPSARFALTYGQNTARRAAAQSHELHSLDPPRFFNLSVVSNKNQGDTEPAGFVYNLLSDFHRSADVCRVLV